jgi:hypothetical protein
VILLHEEHHVLDLLVRGSGRRGQNKRRGRHADRGRDGRDSNEAAVAETCFAEEEGEVHGRTS